MQPRLPLYRVQTTRVLSNLAKGRVAHRIRLPRALGSRTTRPYVAILDGTCSDPLKSVVPVVIWTGPHLTKGSLGTPRELVVIFCHKNRLVTQYN